MMYGCCGSKDRTVEIAKEMGANVITRPFDNFGNQRNYGIDNCKWKHEWVFDLDADERFTRYTIIHPHGEMAGYDL